MAPFSASWGNPRLPPRNTRPTLPARAPRAPAVLPRNKNTSYVTGAPNTKAPAAAAAPSQAGSGLPLDPTYEATIGGLQKKRDELLAGYTAQRPRVLADYGYTAAGYDSSGAPTGLAFDPNNPYSRASLAKKVYDQNQAGTQNSMAARGQLYAGSLDSAKAFNESRYQQGSDALLKSLTEQLVGIAQGERGAKTDYELGAGQAYGDSVSRAQNAPPAPVAAAPAAQSGGSAYNPYTPGTPQWAAYAKQHGQSWKTDSKGRWGYYVNGKWQKA